MPLPFDLDAVQIRCRLVVADPTWELDGEFVATDELAGEAANPSRHDAARSVAGPQWFGRLFPRRGDRRPSAAPELFEPGSSVRIEAVFTASVRDARGPAYVFHRHGLASVLVRDAGPGGLRADVDDVWFDGVGTPPWLPIAGSGSSPDPAGVREPMRPAPDDRPSRLMKPMDST